MKLYHLYRTDGEGYDEAQAFVVQAKNSKEARLVASMGAGGEGRRIWTDSKNSRCKELKPGKTPTIIIRDFHNG